MFLEKTLKIFSSSWRFVAFKFVLKKYGDRADAISYGIGHGGIEILAVILPTMITYLAVAVMFSSGNVENALSTAVDKGALDCTVRARVATALTRAAEWHDYTWEVRQDV